MYRLVLVFGCIAACGSTQKARTFTVAVPQEHAMCRAERMMRTGPWVVEADTPRGRIQAEAAGMKLAALLGTAAQPGDGVPATWVGKTHGSYDTPRSQRIKRNIVVEIDEASADTSTVRVSVEDVACIDDGSSFRGACSVTYPATEEVNGTIRTVGLALGLWLGDAGNTCASTPVASPGSEVMSEAR